MELKEISKDLYDVSGLIKSRLGAIGSEQRKANEDLAWQEYQAQVLHDARKSAKVTQAELAKRIGADKGYISRIERGLTVPTMTTFFRIISALGLVMDLRPANGV